MAPGFAGSGGWKTRQPPDMAARAAGGGGGRRRVVAGGKFYVFFEFSIQKIKLQNFYAPNWLTTDLEFKERFKKF